MTISETVTLIPQSARGSVISAANFGINLVLGYERFGSQPWEKFDEVQAAVGSQVIRFPGGAETERLFDYAHPNATVAVDSDGSVKQLIATDAFLDYCRATQTKAVINLPVEQLLTGGAYGNRDFNMAIAADVRSFIAHVLEKAGPQAISAFELGNEYETYMTAREYGRIASTLATIADQEIDKYYARHPAETAARPDIAVQVWGQSAGGTMSLDSLAGRNQAVISEFNAEELAAITAVDSHFYYSEGINAGKPNFHTYSNIATSVGFSLDMMAAWNTATGRPLDTMFSEWNLNLNDKKNYGLQQIPILLELFTAMVAGGVDQMDFWSTMYHASSLANFRGELQAAGTLFQVMTQELIGLKATDVPVTSSSYDVHAFSGSGKAVLFVSSLTDDPQALKLNLSKYLDRFEMVSAKMMQVDLTKADGTYKGLQGLHPWEEPDAPILLNGRPVSVYDAGGLYNVALGAHETLVLEFQSAPTLRGSFRADTLQGDDKANRIDGLASSDVVSGMGGDDSLYGGSGNDTVSGGLGLDRIWGGVGRDVIDAGAGNDTVEGMANLDLIHGGAGDDYLAGGDGCDQIWGDAGADGFIFRKGEWGADRIMDYSAAQGDFLVFDGGLVTKANFTIESRPVAGLGNEAVADLVIRFGATGPMIWLLQDAGGLTDLHLLDASRGTMIDLI